MQKENDYNHFIDEIKDILGGKINAVLKNLKDQINIEAAQLNFEQAYRLQRKYELLDKYQSKSTIVNSSITEVDVFSIASDEKIGFVNYLKVMHGTIIQTQTIEIKKKLEAVGAKVDLT